MSQITIPCRIPRLIHQTWKNSIVPPHWQASQDAWKKYHPDWEYKLWTDEDNRAFVAEKFPWFLKTFDEFPYGIQRADAIRYCILYVYGGVYCDLDLEPLGNLENLFPNEGVYLVASVDYTKSYTNNFMASSPGQSFWIEVLIEMMKPTPWWAIGKHLFVMTSTGPIMIDRVAKRTTITINVLPSKVMVPCSMCEPFPCGNKYSRIRILPGMSWAGYDTRIYNFLYCNRRVVILIIISMLIYFGYKIGKRRKSLY